MTPFLPEFSVTIKTISQQHKLRTVFTFLLISPNLRLLFVITETFSNYTFAPERTNNGISTLLYLCHQGGGSIFKQKNGQHTTGPFYRLKNSRGDFHSID